MPHQTSAKEFQSNNKRWRRGIWGLVGLPLNRCQDRRHGRSHEEILCRNRSLRLSALRALALLLWPPRLRRMPAVTAAPSAQAFSAASLPVRLSVASSPTARRLVTTRPDTIRRLRALTARHLRALMARHLRALMARRRLRALMARRRLRALPARRLRAPMARRRLPMLSWRPAVTGENEGSGSKV